MLLRLFACSISCTPMLKRTKITYPRAADTVDKAMYVDDVLDSVETIAEAKEVRKQTTDVLAGAGFALRKWMSNLVEVIEDIPVEDRLPGLQIDDGHLPTLKTLGVSWQADGDVFTFRVQTPSSPEVPTKRHMLRSIAQLFDPLQFLAPFTLEAKILMQRIWAAGLEWDEPLPDCLVTEWNTWTAELSDLSQFDIPRCFRLSAPINLQLHSFSDASKDAYATVSYLVGEYSDRSPTSRLIASKCRVSPLKAVTIPCLELMGAVLAARLMQGIMRTLDVNEVTYWTDSTNVLHWLRNQSRNFKPFVANRIAEVQRLTDPSQWRHIPGEANPADLPTRGLSAVELCVNKTWMEGPEFLTNDDLSWPEKITSLSEEVTMEKNEEKAQTHATRHGCK